VNGSAAAGELRMLLTELARVGQGDEGVPAPLIARLASINPSVAEWRQLAATLAAAATLDARREAARAAMARLSSHGREGSGASAPAPEVSALRGWWSEERREGGRR